MTNPSTFQDDWAFFSQSEDFEAVTKGIGAESVQDLVGTYYQVRTELTQEEKTAWTEALIQKSVALIANTAVAGAGSPEEIVAVLTLNNSVAMTFFKCLANAKKIAVSADQIQAMMDELLEDCMVNAVEQGMAGDEDEEAHLSEDLPEWQAEDEKAVQADMMSWGRAFVNGPQWSKVADKLEPDDMLMIVDTLGTRIYQEARLKPDRWTEAALQHTLKGYFVSDVGLQADQYEAVAPALQLFFDFCAANGYLPQATAGQYNTFVENIAQEMIARAQDDSNYSAAKVISLEMLAAGVDMNDDQAVQNFIADFFEKQNKE